MEHCRKLIHITKMPIRWGDMDAYGHVNNTIYFRYMEQARVEWIEDMQVVVRRMRMSRFEARIDGAEFEAVQDHRRVSASVMRRDANNSRPFCAGIELDI